MAGFLAGRTTIRRSLTWCGRHLSWLQERIPLKNGIASPSTVCRLLAGIDEELFLCSFMEWIGEIVDTKGNHLIIDGKALRGAVRKAEDGKTPMILNMIEAATRLVVAQIPIQEKANEITAIPEILKLIDIRGSTVTIDAVGTQTTVMNQIVGQGGHYVQTVKKNQPQAHDEIVKYVGELSEDYRAIQEEGKEFAPRHPEIMKKYDEIETCEKNRDRYEYRKYMACRDVSLLTKAQEEWPHVKTIGLASQVRIPVERDKDGTDITPDKETFLKKGSRRCPRPTAGESEANDIQNVGIISDLELTAAEIGQVKREHWVIENCLHHVLDDTFREDRSPAKQSRNNLSVIRKFVYNILRIAMLREGRTAIMTEMMDEFCDDLNLIDRYIFNGIKSLY